MECWPWSRRLRPPVVRLLRQGFAVFVAFAFLAVTVSTGAMASDTAIEDIALEIKPRGVVTTPLAAQLASDLSAPVQTIGFREGEEFKKGDLLIEFDCRREVAHLKAAEAVAREMQLGLTSARYLRRRNAGATFDVEVSAARHKKAQADVEAAQAAISKCRILAPFDGSVSELGIQRFEQPKASVPFLSIVSKDELEIVAIVPSVWLRWLKVGAPFAYDIDELDAVITARVTRISGAVDPVSQTVKLYARPELVPPDLRVGMSGSVAFLQRPNEG